jgi:homoserine kinase
LHEQYRAGDAPLLGTIRASATDGALGVTLSGSGPSVVVWTAHDRAAEVADRLRATLSDDTRVLTLRVAQKGARLA